MLVFLRKTPEFTKKGEIHELFVVALSLVWFAGATPKNSIPNHLKKFFYLDKFCWVPDACNRGNRQKLARSFRINRVSEVFWGDFWILVGFLSLELCAMLEILHKAMPRCDLRE